MEDIRQIRRSWASETDSKGSQDPERGNGHAQICFGDGIGWLQHVSGNGAACAYGRQLLSPSYLARGLQALARKI